MTHGMWFLCSRVAETQNSWLERGFSLPDLVRTVVEFASLQLDSPPHGMWKYFTLNHTYHTYACQCMYCVMRRNLKNAGCKVGIHNKKQGTAESDESKKHPLIGRLSYIEVPLY